MTKLETASALANSGSRPLIELPAKVDRLQVSMEQMQLRLEQMPAQITEQIALGIGPAMTQIAAFQSSLDQLPPAITEQILLMTGPLMSLPNEVQKLRASFGATMDEVAQKAVTSLDQISEAQRATIDEVTQDIASKSVALLDVRATALDGTIKQAAESAGKLSTHFESVQTTAAQLSEMPIVLNGASVQMRESAGALIARMKELLGEAQEAEQTRIANQPARWKLPAMLLTCAIAAALLNLIGAHLLGKPTPPTPQVVTQIPPQIRKDADDMQTIWRKATPAEIKFLTAIVSRPEK